jgi:branched-subunit amino acid transport protein
VTLSLEPSDLIWLIAAMAAISYAQRVLPFWLAQRLPLERLKEPLRLVPPAVLSALVFQEVFYLNGSLAVSPLANPRLLAAAAAAVAVRFTGKVLPGIAAGMAVFWVLSALM